MLLLVADAMGAMELFLRICLCDLAIGENETAAVAEIPRITNTAWEKVPEDNLGGIEGGVVKIEASGKYICVLWHRMYC